MENKQSISITSHEVQEALEQVRAGFTVSRMALGAATLIYPLKKKDEKWAKKFTKIQNEYHKFLLDCYTELEEQFVVLSEQEKSQNNEENAAE